MTQREMESAVGVVDDRDGRGGCGGAHPGLAGASSAELESLAYCRALTRERAGSFYFGLRLTAEPKRSAMFALYALLRRCDDLADDAGAASNGAGVLARIDRFAEAVDAVFDGDPAHSSLRPAVWHPSHAPSGVEGDAAGDTVDSEIEGDAIWPAVGWLVRQYPIRRELVHAMLTGQRRDARGERYATFDELREYCYEVASTVGLCCLAIWGHDGQARTLEMAEERGVALQLTNILRDVREDALDGRVYLPAEELDRFGCTQADLAAGRASEGFEAMMAMQVARAREYYERSARLEEHIGPDGRATSWAMMSTYRATLERIARRPARVLSERVSLGRLAKATIAGRAVGRVLLGGG